ncbi:plasmid replication protein, CyRepA1 family [Marinomonas arenicola]|uniref:plasmid replication protein, CyRepA1 family n=1 Tax=Marinomonas arenicola TaxID=569601 RepID=UPI00311F1A90
MLPGGSKGKVAVFGQIKSTASGIDFPHINFTSKQNGGYTVTFDGYQALKELYEREKGFDWDKSKKTDWQKEQDAKRAERQRKIAVAEAAEAKQREQRQHEHNAYELAFKRETSATYPELKNGRLTQSVVEFLGNEDGSFDYLSKKQISEVTMASRLKRMRDKNGEFVAIELTDIDGNFKGIQRLYNQFKRYTVAVNDGQFDAAHCVIGNIEPTGKAFVVEGFATGASVWMATETPVIVAMNADNLKKVIKQYRRVYPDLALTNAADNDCWKPLAGNKGLMTAIEIHKEHHVRATYPRWENMPQEVLDTKPTDWNDLHVLGGLKSVSNMIKSNDSRLKSASKYFDYCIQRLAYVGHNTATDEALKAVGAGMMISPIVHSAKEVFQLVVDAIPQGCAFDQYKIKSRIKWIAMGKLERAKGLRSFSNHELNKAHINYIKVQAVPGEHNNMIIPPAVLDLVNSVNGSVIVRAPMGFGKTERLIKPLMHQSQRGAYIAHRVSLIGDASQRLSIANYQDTLAYEVAYTDHIACCVNSIINPKFQNANGLSWFETVDTLCIDEASQVIRHTTGGPVENPVKVMDGLISAMRSSNRVVLCDADANDSLIHLCELARPGETIHIIEVDGNCNDIEVYHTDPDTAFFHAVRMATDEKAPQKILIANDSAKDGERLTVQMLEQNPNLNVLHVHKDSKSDAGVESFLNNPNAECIKYDVVIYSPAISSGVSITTKHFDQHVSIFHAVVAPSDAVQMMRRDRTAKKYMVGIGINNTQRETDREAIYRGLLTADDMASADFVETEEEISLRRRKTPFDEMFLESQATENLARNDFANNLILMMVGDGYRVNRLAGKTEEKDKGKVMKMHAGEQVNNRRIKAVLSEQTPDEDTFNRISRSEMRSREEAVQIDRYHMEKQLCVDVIDEDVINFYDDQGIKKVQRLELLQSTDDQAKAYDHAQFKNKVTVTRHSYKRSTRAVLVSIFDALKINMQTGEGEFTSQDCREVMRQTLSSKESIELYNSLKIGSYVNPKSLPKDATTFVKNIMAKLGLYVSKRKSQGRSVLSISKSDWDLVNGFVKNRIEKGVHSLKIETHETVKPATQSCSEKQPEAATHKACETGTLPQGGVYTDVKYPLSKPLDMVKINNIVNQAIIGTSATLEDAIGWLGKSDLEDIDRGDLSVNELNYYIRVRSNRAAAV